MTSRNRLGWIVEQFLHEAGWIPLPGLPVYECPDEAEAVKAQHSATAGTPLRVCELNDYS